MHTKVREPGDKSLIKLGFNINQQGNISEKTKKSESETDLR